MSVMVRLKRIGTNKRLVYKIVALDSRRKRDGRILEILGYYDPYAGKEKATLFLEKIKAWIGKGALLSPTVKSLFRTHIQKDKSH